MAWIEGASVLFRCGCSVSSGNGYHATLANGNEMPIEKRDGERTKLEATRRAKGVKDSDDKALAEMVSAKVKIDGADVYTLPERCAIHGDGAFQSAAWAFDAVEEKE